MLLDLSHVIWGKLLLAGVILFVTILAAIYPFKKGVIKGHGYEFPIGESLACGVFLGAGLLHLLGEASQHFHQLNIHYPLASFIAGTVFLLFLWLEHLGREVYHGSQKPRLDFAVLALIMLSVHSLLEGTAIGLNDDFSLVIILFLAIIGHKWAASFAVAVYLNKSGFTPMGRFIAFAVFSLMTPMGIFIGGYINTHLNNHYLLEPIFTAMASGTFLYLGTLHGLERGVLVKQCCNLKNFSFVILGFLIMALIAAYD